ncbi:unnamed protein product [Vitrella brassicaformis CCMP3155]|uniref:Uncharacterized protein n=1 Tax=Vitrella brassicaformis (strain CCMP3155) TaxID=1169540 RepID=A0A0G4F1Q5_VITBC|nr:unnamed protein product [Vitrella brassicaformis CCMP3155]|eukprot:CEM05660.1 unnamed protein product [Vitrella brassicaformis CCMP3155]
MFPGFIQGDLSTYVLREPSAEEYPIHQVMLAGVELLLGGAYFMLVSLMGLTNPFGAWFFCNVEMACQTYARQRIKGVPTGQSRTPPPAPPIPLYFPTYFLLVIAFSLSWMVRTAIHQVILLSWKYLLVTDLLKDVDMGNTEKAMGLAKFLFGGLYPHAEAVFPLDSTAAAALLSAPGLIEKLTLFVEPPAAAHPAGIQKNDAAAHSELAIRTGEMQKIHHQREREKMKEHGGAVETTTRQEVKVVHNLLVATKLLGITFALVTISFYLCEFVLALLSLAAITVYFAREIVWAAVVAYRNFIFALATLYFIQLVLIVSLFKRVVGPSGHVSRPAWFHAFFDLMVLVNLPYGLVLGVTRVLIVAASGVIHCFTIDRTPITIAALDAAHGAFLSACWLCHHEFNTLYRAALTCINKTVHNVTMTVPPPSPSTLRRVRNRLWLAVTLHNNPSLIDMRHRPADETQAPDGAARAAVMAKCLWCLRKGQPATEEGGEEGLADHERRTTAYVFSGGTDGDDGRKQKGCDKERIPEEREVNAMPAAEVSGEVFIDADMSLRNDELDEGMVNRPTSTVTSL